jgi:phage recombination protein Bet
MSKSLTIKESWTSEQLDLIKNLCAKGTTDDQFKVFLYTCKRTGLDPLTRQIYCVVRMASKKLDDGSWIKEPTMSIQTGIDGYRTVAVRTKQLAGIDDAVFDTDSQPHPNKATVTVWRLIGDTRQAFTASARWEEYAQYFEDYKTKEKKLGNMWAKMPYLMLGKCAESLALRKAFPNDLSGIYTEEEMQQSENTVRPETLKNVVSEQTVEPEPKGAQITALLNKLGLVGQNRTEKVNECLGWAVGTIKQPTDPEMDTIIDKLQTAVLEKEFKNPVK